LKKLAMLGGVIALSFAAVVGLPLVRAADHLDSPSAAANKLGDIGDVYAWMTADATRINLALTVSPFDDGQQSFGPSVQYVFHVESHPVLGQSGAESKVICTFTDNTEGQCWVVAPDGHVVDYVTGDMTGITGLVSASGKLRAYAGRRSDPSFFNMSGFLTAAASTKLIDVGTLGLDGAGCPTLATFAADTRRAELKAMPTGGTTNGPCGTTAKDCFANANVLAIVVQVDKDELVQGTEKLMSVWAGTYAAPQ
jgi:hypothetical protein